MSDRHQPDVKWALAVLSTVDPFNDLFDKGYLPRKRVTLREPSIHNDDGFFDNLPPSCAKKQRTRLVVAKKLDNRTKKKAIIQRIKKLQERAKNFESPKIERQHDPQSSISRQMSELEIQSFKKVSVRSTNQSKNQTVGTLG